MSSDNIAVELLKQFSQRVMRMNEEKRGINDDIRDIYTEAHSQGIDKKALRDVVRQLEQDQQKRKDHLELVRIYGEQLGLSFE